MKNIYVKKYQRKRNILLKKWNNISIIFFVVILDIPNNVYGSMVSYYQVQTEKPIILTSLLLEGIKSMLNEKLSMINPIYNPYTIIIFLN